MKARRDLNLWQMNKILSVVGRAAPFYVGWSGSGGGGCSNASNAPYAVSDDFKIYNT